MSATTTPEFDYYQYSGLTGGRGLTEARTVHAQAERNPTKRHPDGSLAITFRQSGTTTHYRPATPGDVAEIMAENGARIEGNARLGKAVTEALRAADLQMARWMERMGSGVLVHTGGSWVVVFWWYSTEAERKGAPAPWTGGENGGVRAQVVAALDKAGLKYSFEKSEIVLTFDDNPQI
ncbi:hypothetical protein [Streptomyces sp. XH2]|uniref:hypothetical protein n=1 Tax=Streptomyces sp. XH2 TaxID=3412483 RepID=UPI003C7CBD0E